MTGCASKRDVLELATIRYMNWSNFKLWWFWAPMVWLSMTLYLLLWTSLAFHLNCALTYCVLAFFHVSYWNFPEFWKTWGANMNSKKGGFTSAYGSRLQEISTPDFSIPSFNLGHFTPVFSTMNSSTPDPYVVEKFMFKKFGVEMSWLLLLSL